MLTQRQENTEMEARVRSLVCGLPDERDLRETWILIHDDRQARKVFQSLVQKTCGIRAPLLDSENLQ